MWGWAGFPGFLSDSGSTVVAGGGWWVGREMEGRVGVGGLRVIKPSFVVPGPSGVAIRTRLRVTPAEEKVLGEVGAHLGSLACRDLAARCRDGVLHDKDPPPPARGGAHRM